MRFCRISSLKIENVPLEGQLDYSANIQQNETHQRRGGFFSVFGRSFFDNVITKKSKIVLGLLICHFFMEESARNKRKVAYDPISWLRVKEGKF